MSENKNYRIGILATHPIQYYSPLYKTLSNHPEINLTVYYCHQQSKYDQSAGGFNVEFDWDVELLEGFSYKFLDNISKNPNVYSFFGCDTPEIKKIINDTNFDAFIVQGWYLKSFWQTMFACWKSGTPILVRGDSQLHTNRSIVMNILKYPLYRFFIPKFDAYLAVGKRSEQYFKYYGAKKEKIFFTPHCVDNDYFESNVEKYQNSSSELKNKYNIPKDSIVFLFVGKLISKKRPQDFLKAIKIASNSNSRIIGLIVGDGQLRKELELMIKNENINALLTGFINQSQLPEVYSISNFIILPSDGGETWGLVVNEAMACGIPAIVSDQVGCSEDLIKADITGRIFSCGDVNELKNIIIRYSHDNDLTASMKKNVKEHIMNFTISNATEGIVKAVKKVSLNKKVNKNIF